MEANPLLWQIVLTSGPADKMSSSICLTKTLSVGCHLPPLRLGLRLEEVSLLRFCWHPSGFLRTRAANIISWHLVAKHCFLLVIPLHHDDDMQNAYCLDETGLR